MRRGTVGVTGLLVPAIIGAYPEEQLREQPLEIDFSVQYDFSDAIETDSLERAVDYAGLVELIQRHLTSHRYTLLESAAAGILRTIRTGAPEALRIVVEIRKPAALPGTAVSYARLDTAEVSMDDAAARAAPG